MEILAAVLSLGSLACEFQIFYNLLSVGESMILSIYHQWALSVY